MKLADLTVDSYLLYENPLRGTFLTLRRMPFEEGMQCSVRWGIFKESGAWLCKIRKDVHWIFMGLPSNRTEKDYKGCRWETAQEALDFWETVKERAIEKAEPPMGPRTGIVK